MNATIPLMPKLVPGLYALPLTRELREALDPLEAKHFAAKTDSPHPADAHELLGRHFATLGRQILQAFRGDDPLTRPAEICNEVLAALLAVPFSPVDPVRRERMLFPLDRSV